MGEWQCAGVEMVEVVGVVCILYSAASAGCKCLPTPSLTSLSLTTNFWTLLVCVSSVSCISCMRLCTLMYVSCM